MHPSSCFAILVERWYNPMTRSFYSVTCETAVSRSNIKLVCAHVGGEHGSSDDLRLPSSLIPHSSSHTTSFFSAVTTRHFTPPMRYMNICIRQSLAQMLILHECCRLPSISGVHCAASSLETRGVRRHPITALHGRPRVRAGSD